MELQFLAKVFYKPISWLAEPQIFPAAMNVFPLLLPTVLTAYAQSDFHLGCLHRRFELHVATWKAQLAPPLEIEGRVRPHQSGERQFSGRSTQKVSFLWRFPVEGFTAADHRAGQKPSSIHTLLLSTSPRMAR